MISFEEELKKALSRVEPPDGFSARVLSSVAGKESTAARWTGPALWLQWPLLRWAGALVLMLALGSGLVYREMLRKREGEAAKKQLLVAMHIAGTQLHEAQLRVKRIEFPGVMMQ